MLFLATVFVSLIAAPVNAVSTGKYCGTSIFWGYKLTCSLDVNDETSTLIFEIQFNGESSGKHENPVGYRLEGDNFILDESDEAFAAFLASQFSLFTVRASDIVSVYDHETDRINSQIVIPLFSVPNVLTKYKCSAPLLEGTYKNAKGNVSVVIQSTDATVDIDLGDGTETETFAYTVDMDGKMKLDGSDIEVAVLPGDNLIVSSKGSVMTLSWTS
jgi:hypothetical protein